MGVEYYKGKPIPLFESVKFNKEIGYGLSASDEAIYYMNSKITALYRA